MKKIRMYFILLLIIMLLSGCYRTESTLTISSDRSVDLSVKILVDKDFNETQYLNNIGEYDIRKIKIQRITESNYKGYQINKNYSSIDEISSETDVTLDITKYFDKGFNDKYLFKVEKGFLKNIYTGSFTINNDVVLKRLANNTAIQTEDDFLNIVKNVYNTAINHVSKTEKTYSDDKNELKIAESIKYSIQIDKSGNVINIGVFNDSYKYNKTADKILLSDILKNDIIKINNDQNNKYNNDAIKFVVKLPHKSISNNATEVSGSGETLTWIFNPDKENNINFSFELANRKSYLTVFIFTILVFTLFILLIIVLNKVKDKKRKNIEATPIFQSEENVPKLDNNIIEINEDNDTSIE